MTAVEGERAMGPPIDDDTTFPPPEQAGPLGPRADAEDSGAGSSGARDSPAGDSGAAEPAAEPAAGPSTGEAAPESDTVPSSGEPESGTVPSSGEPESDAGPSSGEPETDTVPSSGEPETDTVPSSGEPESDAGPSSGEPETDTVPSTGEAVPEPDAAPADAAPRADPPVGSPVPRRRGRALGALLLAVLLALGGGVAGAWAALTLRPTPPPAPVSMGLLSAVDAVAPAVLRIQAGPPDTGTAGTALVVTPTGDVVTNEHLVHGETTATLIHPDGRRDTARVVAVDETADLAWLRIDGAQGLPVVRLAGPGAVRPGEDVIAIGNALNLDGPPSITRGIVSAVGRSTATLTDVIQTDAAISSGSSGGALVDPTGTVVGVTTEALVGDPTVSVEDIAFAIPADRVVAVLRGMGLVLPG